MRVRVAKEAMSSDETLGGKTRLKVAYLNMTVLVQTKGPIRPSMSLEDLSVLP